MVRRLSIRMAEESNFRRLRPPRPLFEFWVFGKPRYGMNMTKFGRDLACLRIGLGLVVDKLHSPKQIWPCKANTNVPFARNP